MKLKTYWRKCMVFCKDTVFCTAACNVPNVRNVFLLRDTPSPRILDCRNCTLKLRKGKQSGVYISRILFLEKYKILQLRNELAVRSWTARLNCFALYISKGIVTLSEIMRSSGKAQCHISIFKSSKNVVPRNLVRKM